MGTALLVHGMARLWNQVAAGRVVGSGSGWLVGAFCLPALFAHGLVLGDKIFFLKDLEGRTFFRCFTLGSVLRLLGGGFGRVLLSASFPGIQIAFSGMRGGGQRAVWSKIMDCMEASPGSSLGGSALGGQLGWHIQAYSTISVLKRGLRMPLGLGRRPEVSLRSPSSAVLNLVAIMYQGRSSVM